MRIGIVAALAALVTGGCYRYTPIEPEQLRPGLEVRARVTAAQAERLREEIGLDTREIDGTVVELAPAVVLSVRTASVATGSSVSYLRQRVDLPSHDIVELERRELDRAKTFGVVAVAAAAAGAAIATAFSDDEGGGPDQPRPSPDEILVPLLRWSF